jgi:hypothetical protein
VILHEEAEDGNAMPDLERPVMAVSRAVTNLVKVKKDIHSRHVTYKGALCIWKSVYQTINCPESWNYIRLLLFVASKQFGTYLYAQELDLSL